MTSCGDAAVRPTRQGRAIAPGEQRRKTQKRQTFIAAAERVGRLVANCNIGVSLGEKLGAGFGLKARGPPPIHVPFIVLAEFHTGILLSWPRDSELCRSRCGS